MADLLVLRHAQSVWNAERRWQGRADPPLSDLGEEQARAAGGWIASLEQDFDGIVTSDLQRARRTAEIVAAALGIGRVEPEAALRERDVGAWTGLTADEIEARWPGAIAAWRGGLLSSPPGGESDAALVARVRPVLERLCARPAPAIVVVTHGGAIRALERALGAGGSTTANMCGRWFTSARDALVAGPAAALPGMGEEVISSL